MEERVIKTGEYTIPAGMDAEIKDGKVIVREKESEDEMIRKDIVVSVELRLTQSEKAEIYAYLEKLKESLHISETCKENADSFTKDLENNPQTSAAILRHYLVWSENSEEDCPYTWKVLAGAIMDGIKALEEQKPSEELMEVDLEKEIIRYQREDMERDTTVRDVARHFYELGLNARKEE